MHGKMLIRAQLPQQTGQAVQFAVGNIVARADRHKLAYIAARRPQQAEPGGSTQAGRKRERAARREGKRQGKLPEFADRLN